MKTSVSLAVTAAYLAIAAASAACNGQATETQAKACDPHTPGTNGHLGACAAGTPSENGPGVPIDFAGQVHRSMTLTASERAAVERANALAAKRAERSTIDRGFGLDVPKRAR